MKTAKGYEHSSTGTGGKQPWLGRWRGVAINANFPAKEKRRQF